MYGRGQQSAMFVTSCLPKELYISYKMKQQCFKCSVLYFTLHNSQCFDNIQQRNLNPLPLCSINERSFLDICVNLLNYANIL